MGRAFYNCALFPVCPTPDTAGGFELVQAKNESLFREKYDLETFREVGGKIYIYNSLIDMVIIHFGWNTKHFNNSASFYYMK